MKTTEVAIDASYSRFEAAEAAAAAKGCTILLPADNELFIDIDNEADMAAFNRGLDMLRTVYQCTYTCRPSPSGKAGRWHIVVKLDEHVTLTALDRVALQACLGSDRVREFLSWVRILNDEKHPTLFFEKEGT